MENIYGIGTIAEEKLTHGMMPMEGTYEKKHDNYGNYIDKHGSVYGCFPTTYSKKLEDGTYDFSFLEIEGYTLERAFINADKVKDAVFVMKYIGSNNNGILTSSKDAKAVTTNSDFNPVSKIDGCLENRFDEMYTACKSIGDDFFLTSIFIWDMLSRMKKTYDPSKQKNTHNGLKNGIVSDEDMWDIASGFTRNDDKFITLKQSADITKITKESAYDFENYDSTCLLHLANNFDVFGKSYAREYCTCLVGGYWSHGSLAGAFTLTLSNSRADSDNSVGGRASVFL